MDLITRFDKLIVEFKLIEDKQDYLDIASEHVTNASLSQVQKDTLIVYYAAHMIDIALRSQQASGAVSSISEGKLSIAYNVVKAEDSLDTTKYGSKYKLLCRQYLRYMPQTIWI